MRILKSPTGPSITPQEALSKIPAISQGGFSQAPERSYADVIGDIMYAASTPLAGLRAAGFGSDYPMRIPTRAEVDRNRTAMDLPLALTAPAGAAYLASAAAEGQNAASLAAAAVPAGRKIAPLTRIVDEPIWQKITKRANELLADYQANPKSAPMQLKKDIGGTMELKGGPLREFTDAAGDVKTSSGGVDVNLRLADGTVIPTGSMGFHSRGKAGALMDEGNMVTVMTRVGDFPFEKSTATPLRDQLVGSGASSLMTSALNQAMKEQGLRLSSSGDHSAKGLSRYLKLKDRGVVKQIGGKEDIPGGLSGDIEEAAYHLGIRAPQLDDLQFAFPDVNVREADGLMISDLTDAWYEDKVEVALMNMDDPRFLFYKRGGKFKILKK